MPRPDRHGWAAPTPPGPLVAWFQTPAGAWLLWEERALLRAAVRRFHGNTLVWVGLTPHLLDTTAQCMVRSRVFASVGAPRSGRDESAQRNAPSGGDVAVLSACPGALPFATGAADGVLLHHALEAAPDPRAALREAARVLRVGGRLVVAGFNPLSAWLFTKPLPAFRTLKSVSVPRLRDWLALLGLEAEGKPSYVGVGAARRLRGAGADTSVPPPGQSAVRWWRRLPPGGVYLVCAVKVGHGFVVPPLGHRERAALGAALPNPVACIRPAA